MDEGGGIDIDERLIHKHIHIDAAKSRYRDWYIDRMVYSYTHSESYLDVAILGATDIHIDMYKLGHGHRSWHRLRHGNRNRNEP